MISALSHLMKQNTSTNIPNFFIGKHNTNYCKFFFMILFVVLKYLLLFRRLQGKIVEGFLEIYEKKLPNKYFSVCTENLFAPFNKIPNL